MLVVAVVVKRVARKAVEGGERETLPGAEDGKHCSVSILRQPKSVSSNGTQSLQYRYTEGVVLRHFRGQ